MFRADLQFPRVCLRGKAAPWNVDPSGERRKKGDIPMKKTMETRIVVPWGRSAFCFGPDLREPDPVKNTLHIPAENPSGGRVLVLPPA